MTERERLGMRLGEGGNEARREAGNETERERLGMRLGERGWA